MPLATTQTELDWTVPPKEDDRDRRRVYYYLSTELHRRPVSDDPDADWDFFDCAGDEDDAIEKFEAVQTQGMEFSANIVETKAKWFPGGWWSDELGMEQWSPGCWEYEQDSIPVGGFLWRDGQVVERW
ncbi:MAG: hypothetical protein DHS20C16_15540 [Phycisphaerae bacterium]|nr:MAG: hypothetical protein DHS20C16_15540 [Phycisphaerae bacterium]